MFQVPTHYTCDFLEYPETGIEGVGYLVHIGGLAEDEIVGQHRAICIRSYYQL
jgi:hypothetical protein